MDGLRLFIFPPFQCPLDGTDPTHLLFQYRFGMAVRLKDRLGRFAQLMELAELVWHPWQQLGDCLTNRLLAIGDHASDWHRQGFGDLTE